MQFKFDSSEFENEKDPELQQILNELYDAYDKLMIYMIKKQVGCDVRIVDDEHISIDGKILDNDEFEKWLDENYPLPDTKAYEA